MRISKSTFLKIGVAALVLILVLFQNCSSGFQTVAMNTNTTGASTSVVDATVVAQCTPSNVLPNQLSETCYGKLTPALLSGKTKYANYFEFAPRYPGYSDGSAKRRWIFIPAGQKINTQDPDNWIFPKGTVIYKEFSVGSKKIETRQLEKLTNSNGVNAWRFSNYAWTTDQSDAELVTVNFYNAPIGVLNGFAAAQVISQFKMSSPTGCISCHSGAADVVNGFNYLQLSSQALIFSFNQASQAGLVSYDPGVPDNIKGSALDQQAIGYIQSNCAICHGPNGPGTGNFRHSYLAQTLAQEPVLVTAGSLNLISKGNPDQSLLYMRFSSNSMPLIHPITQDAAGVALIRSWIMSLQ